MLTSLGNGFRTGAIYFLGCPLTSFPADIVIGGRILNIPSTIPPEALEKACDFPGLSKVAKEDIRNYLSNRAAQAHNAR